MKRLKNGSSDIIFLMRLYVVRHGQTEWNLALRAQGHSDIPLDATGQQQVVALRRAFQSIPTAKVISSDLSRAVETAHAISEDVETEPLLRERCFGAYEGWDFAQIKEAMGDGFLTTAPPGGETLQDIWDRLDPVVERLNLSNEPTAVVTHGGTASILLAKLIQGSLMTCRAFRLGNTSITELERREEGHWMIVRLNDVSHLDEMPAEGDLEGSRARVRA